MLQDLQELLESYFMIKDEDDMNYDIMCKEVEKIQEQISLLEIEIQNLLNKKDELEKEYYNGRTISWIDCIVKPLVDVLEKKTKLHGEIYGPFGLTNQTSIYLRCDLHKPITDQKTLCLTVRPPVANKFFYETGEVTDIYPKGSIGDLNGMGNVLAPVPNEFDEIISIMHGDKDLLENIHKVNQIEEDKGVN